MKVTIFHKPYGHRNTVECRNVRPDDEAWFQQHNVKISMEETCGTYVVYGDIGAVNEDGEPDEIIVFSDGRPCEVTLAALRRECEQAMKEGKACPSQ